MIIARSVGLISLCVLLAAADLAAQDSSTHVLDLAKLLETVRTNNAELRASRLEADALAERRSQVSTLPDPQVGVTYLPYPLFTARGSQRSQWRVEQAIPFPGTLSLRGDIAGFRADIASYEALTFEHDLLFEAKNTYFDLYRIQRQQAIIRSFQERLRDFEQNAATRYVVGTGMQQSILKAQLERNTLEQRLLALGIQQRSAVETLARLMDEPVSVITIGEVQPPEAPEKSVDALLDAAKQRRSEARALDAAKKRTEAQVALAEKAFFPDFGFNVTYFDVGRADIPATATGRDALAIGFTIQVPLWRERLKARLNEARLERRRVMTRIEGLDTSFRTQIADLTGRLVQEREQMILYRDALLPQAETSLQATLSSYATGRADFLDLLDAERMLFSLQLAYEDAFARYMRAVAALERALGVNRLSELDRF